MTRSVERERKRKDTDKTPSRYDFPQEQSSGEDKHLIDGLSTTWHLQALLLMGRRKQPYGYLPIDNGCEKFFYLEFNRAPTWEDFFLVIVSLQIIVSRESKDEKEGLVHTRQDGVLKDLLTSTKCRSEWTTSPRCRDGSGCRVSHD